MLSAHVESIENVSSAIYRDKYLCCPSGIVVNGGKGKELSDVEVGGDVPFRASDL